MRYRFLLIALFGIVALNIGDWYCKRCGHSNPDYEKSCNYCGQSK
ncbi:MAG: zinc-ribbon domain-containing protein [Chlamydiia bacterium]|nr:zinc-ribbon domain-containing protein [Chlamydiia bacterium]